MPTEEIPPHYFPVVGRHTEAVPRERESESRPVSVRRRSVVEAPELKKAKIESSSVAPGLEHEAPGGITPGEPIFGTQEDSPDDDVEIPAADVMASQAKEILVGSGFPVGFKSLGPQQIDLTEQDKAFDELSGATPNQDSGAGLLRHLNSETSPLHFDSAVQASMHAPIISNATGAAHPATENPAGYQAPQIMPPWLADIYTGLQGLHNKADRQYADIVAGLQIQGVRLSQIEAVTSEHTQRHEQSDARLSSI